MKKQYLSLKKFVIAHKVISAIVALALILGGYRAFAGLGTTAAPRYVLSTVERGTLVSSITGTGQVSAENQVDVKSKVSGDIISLPISGGQEVKAGQLLAQIDAKNAAVDLENARISYAKLVTTDPLTMTQAENAVAAAKESYASSVSSLSKTYDDGFNEVTDAYSDMQAVFDGLHDMLLTGNGFISNQKQYQGDIAQTYRLQAERSYNSAKDLYDTNYTFYKTLTRTSATSSIETAVNTTYDSVKSLSQAVKDAKTAVEFLRGQATAGEKNTADAADASVTSWSTTVNSHLASLTSVKNSIQSSHDSVQSANRSLIEKTTSLEKLQAGADPLDVRSEQLSLQQKINAYQDYSIRAPFDGMIAKVSVKRTDSISNGTAIATLISKERIAEISLNEVDASKVKVGQKATLTFDAVDGLSISGKVIDLDLVGTVSQGVVTYNVKIGFDTEDERVKPGMTVSAAIITDAKTDVLMVPSSAVKTQGGSSYVETLPVSVSASQAALGVVSATLPSQVDVEVGLSNDAMVEVISGLKEGDQVITRTITATTKTTTSAPSLFGGTGARAGATGGNAVRITR